MHSPPSGDLTGRVAVVTGSTRGIGLATALSLARPGASVVFGSRTPEVSAAAAARLCAEGLTVSACACHIARDTDRRRLIDHAVTTYGGLDILVCNAAINPVFDPLETITEEVWSKIFASNLTSLWALAKLAVPVMAGRGGGVLVSSVAGAMAVPHAGASGASKAAANHLVRQLAFELADRQIRVNAVAPGTTRTDMIRSILVDEAKAQAIAALSQLGRIAEPENIAEAILFLASDLSRHVTSRHVSSPARFCSLTAVKA